MTSATTTELPSAGRLISGRLISFASSAWTQRRLGEAADAPAVGSGSLGKSFTLDDEILSTRAESRVPYPKGYRDRWVEIWRKKFPRMNPTKHALTARYRRIVGLEKRGCKTKGEFRGCSLEARQASNDQRQLSESQTGPAEKSLSKESKHGGELRLKVRGWKKLATNRWLTHYQCSRAV